MRRSVRRLSGLTIALLILSLLLAEIGPVFSSPQVTTTMLQPMQSPEFSELSPPSPENNGEGGLQLELSEGAEQPETVDVVPPIPAQPLDESEIQLILGRLPPLDVAAEDREDFRLPEETLAPPPVGGVISQTFPATSTVDLPVETPSGPLEVLRFAPEGELQTAPFLNVTFNQPMVPLTTIEELSAADVPVTLTPEITGTWKWLGTKTLRFEYIDSADVERDDSEPDVTDRAADRFPMATEFVAEIPAGTTSATGNELSDTVRWTFRTPPPGMTYSYPSYGPQPRDPLLFVAFDQRVDPAAVLETIRVTASGEEYPVVLASADEIAQNKQVARLMETSGSDRGLAFRATREFPADTTVTVNVGPNTPSAEGPLTTETVQSFSFQTYAPLRIEEYECGWGGRECPPFTPFNIRFNNPLDEQAFDASQITITPEIPGLTIANYGTTVNISGATAGRTKYTVVVSGSIKDAFGQTLGEDETLSFTTSSAPRTLYGSSSNFVTLDPSATKPTFNVYTVNYERLRVRAYAVEPADWNDYREFARYAYRDEPPDPPGTQVLSNIFSIDAVPDMLTETAIDLSEALTGDTGHLFVIVDFPPNPFFPERNRQQVFAWVQVTQIGLDAFSDHSNLVAWTTDLATGAPIEDAEVKLFGTDTAVSSGPDGVARLSLTSKWSPLLLATKGDDTAILPASTYYWSDEGWSDYSVFDSVRWYVIDDRQMYRPGEEVHLKGWVRQIGGAQDADLSLVESTTGVRYQVFDPQGNQLHDGMLDINGLGGFDLAFSIPENANLGYASVQLELPGLSSVNNTSYYHQFQIQEFRRPEFEVSAQVETKAPHFVGGEAILAVSAQYFAGGPLPNAETHWDVTSLPGSYSPPNWPEFIFGMWTPWWYYEETSVDSSYASYAGATDASGVHYLQVAFPTASEPRPYNITAEAVVMDVNRQAWSASTSMLVHPSDLYVGLRSERTFVKQGEPLEIQVIVTDLDGNPVEDRPVTVTAVRLDWKFSGGRWVQEESDAQECVVGSQLEPSTCTFETAEGGRYQITAQVTDSEGRANVSQFSRWVSGGRRPTALRVEQEEAQLIPEQETFQPGDTARILVQSPFVPAEGLLTISRQGIVETQQFTMQEPTHVLEIPILDEYIPNVHVQVDLAGAAERTDASGEPVAGSPSRPAYATGSLNLSIPPLSRTLDVTLSPEANELEPGATTAIDLTVTDPDGAPVEDAELAVIVVDEAILALTSYQLRDPISIFYQTLGSGVRSHYGRASIVLVDPQVLANQIATQADEAEAARAPAATAMPAAAPEMAGDMAIAEEAVMDSEGADGDDGAGRGAIAVRTDFNPLATFAPAVRTDASGQATVDVKLPDNLTRYRLMAVAVSDGKFFGSAASNLTARLPLMVRPAAPRFLNFGDRFELPIVLQNQTNEDMQVDLVVRAGNLALPEGQGRRVEIPANDRREVRLPATTENAGTVRMQIAAVAGSYADAATVELPVFTPATTEAFATYGVLDEGAVVQPVAAPQNVYPQFGGLAVDTSSTALQALTDAYLYLVTYPYECSEQIASRVLGVAALRDVLTAFSAPGLPEPTTINATVARDIERLSQMQNRDGGFPIWTRGKPSIPFYSIHATHALQRARLKDYAVPDDVLFNAREHLRNIESHYPAWYSVRTRRTLSAYALYVRDLMGDVDTGKARRLLNEVPLEDHSIETIAWLWQVLSGDASSGSEVERIRRFINNRAVETPGAANFTTAYGDDDYLLLHSNRRTDAVVLDALINDAPESDLIPKVVNGLLAHRNNGRWRNTQENVFILLALDRYFNTFESVTPDFVARFWLGETYAGAHEFVGRTTERQQTLVPMRYLTDPELSGGDTQDLLIAKEGDGRLYYRLGLSYAPTDLDLDPLDMGFVVQRTYEAVDDPADVQRDEDGVWHIKAGTRVRIRVSMVANNRRYHVALVDPLPAGLEIINPALAVSESIPQDPNDRSTYGWWWWRPWYEHQNLRDERAEAFATLLWEGVYDYSYVARATTPGEFVAPPAKAEEMYSPEVFGRSSSDRVIVE